MERGQMLTSTTHTVAHADDGDTLARTHDTITATAAAGDG
jgi:hypothetical protein